MLRTMAAFAATMLAVAGECYAETTLKVVTAFPRNQMFNAPGLQMFSDINAKGKGVLQLQYIGGPETIPATEQLAALQRGVFDIFMGAASYYDGQVPETGAHNASNKSAMQLRADGALELLNQAFSAKANAQYLAYLGSGYTFYIFLKSEPKRKPNGGVDFTGLKIRGPSIYRPFYETQGITAVNVQVPEIYSALERGVVEGVGFPQMGMSALGWHKHLKYRILPTFWQGDLAIVANLDVWKKLDPKARQLLQNAAIETEKKAHDFFQAEQRKEEKVMLDAGVKDIVLQGEEGRKYAAAAFNSLWDQLGKRLSKPEVDRLRKAFYKE